MRNIIFATLVVFVCAFSVFSQTTEPVPSPTPVVVEAKSEAPAATKAEGETTTEAAEPQATPTPEPEAKVRPCSGWLGLGLHSRYTSSTDGAVFANEAVTQNEIGVTCTHKLLSGTAILWTSKGFKENWKGYSDEVDEIFSVTVASSFTFKFANYHLVPQAGSNVQTAGIEMAQTFPLNERNNLTTSVGFDWYWPTKDSGPKSGKFLTVANSVNTVVNERVNISNELRYARDIDGAFGFRKANVLIYNLSADVGLGRGWTVTPKFTLGGAFGDPDRPFKTSFGIVFTKTFSF